MLQLFRTLAENPHLAKWVIRLGVYSTLSVAYRKLIIQPEIRDFPKGLSMPAYEELLVHCRDGLHNCVNLRRCTWTRDGSVNSWILGALQDCPNLQELEINGNHQGHYDAAILQEFDKLRKISLIMPSGPVLDALPVWIRATGPTLQSLTLICKVRLRESSSLAYSLNTYPQTSPLVTDALLQSMAPDLAALKHLHIVGCPKVTHSGIWPLISSNTNGLVGLGLENLSQSFVSITHKEIRSALQTSCL